MIAQHPLPQRAPPRNPPQRQGFNRTLSIVIADDDHDSADGLAMLLRQWNHRVRVAYEGRHAIELFRAQHPDLIVLDIVMPGMDGYETVARVLREDPSAVVVALTASMDRRRAMRMGFREVFAKPVDLDALQEFLAGVKQGD
jgi:CheY-like chemotaxis protein